MKPRVRQEPGQIFHQGLRAGRKAESRLCMLNRVQIFHQGPRALAGSNAESRPYMLNRVQIVHKGPSPVFKALPHDLKGKQAPE